MANIFKGSQYNYHVFEIKELSACEGIIKFAMPK